MKYRRLHRTELEAVKDEFVQFLATHSVTAPDWEKLKAEDLPKAEGLIDIFSDLFWEKALSAIKFVEVRNSRALRVIHFEEKQASMVELRLPAESALDLTEQKDLKGIAEGTIDFAAHQPELFTGKRQFTEARNTELFLHIESGARPCKEGLYLALKALVGDYSE